MNKATKIERSKAFLRNTLPALRRMVWTGGYLTLEGPRGGILTLHVGSKTVKPNNHTPRRFERQLGITSKQLTSVIRAARTLALSEPTGSVTFPEQADDDYVLSSGQSIDPALRPAFNRLFNDEDLSIDGVEGLPTQVEIEGGENWPRDLVEILASRFEQRGIVACESPGEEETTYTAVYQRGPAVIVLELSIGEYMDDDTDARGTIYLYLERGNKAKRLRIEDELRKARRSVYDAAASMLSQFKSQWSSEVLPFLREQFEQADVASTPAVN